MAALVKFLFSDILPPKVVLARPDCVKSEDGTLVKPISKMNLDPCRTLVLDDKKYTFEKNIENAILLPAYSPVLSIEGLRCHDPSLSQLMDWLMSQEVLFSEDVRTLNKSAIFVPR